MAYLILFSNLIVLGAYRIRPIEKNSFSLFFVVSTLSLHYPKTTSKKTIMNLNQRPAHQANRVSSGLCSYALFDVKVRTEADIAVAVVRVDVVSDVSWIVVAAVVIAAPATATDARAVALQGPIPDISS